MPSTSLSACGGSWREGGWGVRRGGGGGEGYTQKPRANAHASTLPPVPQSPPTPSPPRRPPNPRRARRPPRRGKYGAAQGAQRLPQQAQQETLQQRAHQPQRAPAQRAQAQRTQTQQAPWPRPFCSRVAPCALHTLRASHNRNCIYRKTMSSLFALLAVVGGHQCRSKLATSFGGYFGCSQN